MNRLPAFSLSVFPRQTRRRVLLSCLLIILLGIQVITLAEGTKQLEPKSAPLNSVCRLVLLQNLAEYRIPFALVGCAEEYRLNIRVSDFKSEKIYLGFGNIIDYSYDTTIYKDVCYQVKDPDGNVVSGTNLQPMPPAVPGGAGFINTRAEAESGPDINNSNPGGYNPMIINPLMNGDYYIEFQIPPFVKNQIRTFKYIDITVANGNKPVPGRLWSKAWQLGSGSVTADKSASYSLFYIYTNDSIVTRFDCNGMAGGVWDIYSNEWGCTNTGIWSESRRSITGNATVKPEYRIFLNDPDSTVFPSGHIGKLNDFKFLNVECDTVVTFAADVSKAGNIELMIDVPPFNSLGPEDVKLVYKVNPGYNVLLPAWDGKDGHGVPLENGTQIKTRMSFLNGLSNVPLYDVEDNPRGFKVDLQRPLPVAGVTKLKLYWDDSKLPVDKNPTRNITDGCLYNPAIPTSGCHSWGWTNNKSLGDTNTVNTWWYLITDDSIPNPITLKLRPSSGHINGPATICSGQLTGFNTLSIPFAKQYLWNISGPGFSKDFKINAPDTSLFQMFPSSTIPGNYTLSVFGRNPQCRDGDTVSFNSYIYDYIAPPFLGESSVCNNATNQYQLSGSFSKIHWSVKNGDIIGSPDASNISIRWHMTGNDTIYVSSTTNECGTRTSAIAIVVNPAAGAAFANTGEPASCPGIPLSFRDQSHLETGSVISRTWDWGDGNSHAGNDTLVVYSFRDAGNFDVNLKVATDKGCVTSISKRIRIIPYPEASFSWFRNCQSQPILLSDNSTGIDLASRKWDFGNAPVTAANLNLSQPDAIFRATGQFPVKLLVVNQYGCRDSVIHQVKIHRIPHATFTNEFPCQGTGILFTDRSIAADTALTQYSWNIMPADRIRQSYSGNPALIVFDKAVDYSVSLVATDGYGCADTTTSLIAVRPKPDCSFEYTEDSGNRKGTLYFQNLTTGAKTYSWDFGNNMVSAMPNPEITYGNEGQYIISLIASSDVGCRDTAVKLYYYLPVLTLPNAFSPDNNGHNDIFRPVTKRNTLEPYKLMVFNRWGQLIFSTDNPSEGWDGTADGKACEAGTYSYLVRYRKGPELNSGTITRRGFVSLIR